MIQQSITLNGALLKPSELVCVMEKVWGHEEWIINIPEYCGKKLVFKAGYQCSMHHHKIKTETFYVQEGRVVLETEFQGIPETRILTPGDVAHITVGTWHRLSAITPSQVFEFSTFHREDDSYRRTESGKADFNAMRVPLL